MKPLRTGLVILAVLLALGFGAAVAMGQVHRELSSTLEQAADLAQGDWTQANSLAESAKEIWSCNRHWVAALADHEPLEEISALLSQLALCQRIGDREEFSAVCLRIASLCDMLSESHTAYWWNLL